MPEIVTAKFKNCFEADTPEKEFIVNDQSGTELCRFTARQLTIYQINRCKSDDAEILNAGLIKAGIKNFSINGTAQNIDDAFIGGLGRSRFNGTGIVEGLFEIMAAAVMGINTVGEGEAKNSV